MMNVSLYWARTTGDVSSNGLPSEWKLTRIISMTLGKVCVYITLKIAYHSRVIENYASEGLQIATKAPRRVLNRSTHVPST
jgi:hypothetical protein